MGTAEAQTMKGATQNYGLAYIGISGGATTFSPGDTTANLLLATAEYHF